MNISISLDEEAYESIKNVENKSALVNKLIKDNSKPNLKDIINDLEALKIRMSKFGWVLEFQIGDK